MLFNAIEAIVENGIIRLREDVSLPENARVYVIMADLLDPLSTRVRSPRLVDKRRTTDFKKKIVELPADAKL